MTNYVSVSPLKAIQGARIQDHSSGNFVPRPLGGPRRQPPPPQTPEWVSLPKGSLHPEQDDLIIQNVSIPTRPIYRRNLKPPQIDVKPPVEDHDTNKWRKRIISRQLLVNGNIIFVVGTKFGGIITRDQDEVPLSKILDHVTPVELQRYENEDFLAEDVREEKRLALKAKRRPRKGLQPTSKGVNRVMTGRQLTLRGRSAKGEIPSNQSRKFAVIIPPSPSTSRMAVNGIRSGTTNVPSIKGHQPFSVQIRVPSFNGPQPGEVRRLPQARVFSEGSEDELSNQKTSRRPQYSMVAASGLAPSETSFDEETSRDISRSRAPSQDPLSLDMEPLPKRRKIATNGDLPVRAASPINYIDRGLTGPNSHTDIILDVAEEPSESSDKEGETEHVDTIEVRDEEAEREALLRQFQTSHLQHRSRDSPSPHPMKPLSVVNSSPITLSAAEKATIRAKEILNQVNAQLQHPETPSIPLIVSPPRKASPRKQSLTPHFPRGARFSYHDPNRPSDSKYGDPLPPKKLPRDTRNASPPTKIKHPLEATLPSHPKSNHSSHRLQTTKTREPPSKQPQPRKPSTLAPKSNIKHYFQPASKPISIHASDSESEDPLTRASSSSSLKSVISVQRPSQQLNRAFDAAIARENETCVEIPDSEDEDGDVRMQLEQDLTRTAQIQPALATSRPSRGRGSSEEEDSDESEDGDEDEDTSDDGESLRSIIMTRPGR